jgi:hypothetical protein
MTSTTAPRRTGLLVHPDDLQVGKFYAVYGVKHDPEQTHPVFGQVFKLTAVNVPFLVGKLVADPAHPAVTLDVRFLGFMKLTPDFVKAQTPSHVPDAD